jgi:hypothetical protein
MSGPVVGTAVTSQSARVEFPIGRIGEHQTVTLEPYRFRAQRLGVETIQRLERAVGADIVVVDLLGSERAGDREAPHGRGDSGTDGGWQLPPELPPN